MRIFMLLICLAITISSAYWAYSENYRTQAALKRVNRLHQDISKEREAISILNAEWAYLNRPERLRELVDLNFEDLQLVPLSSEHFGETELVTFPKREIPINSPVDVKGNREAGS